MGEPEFFRFEPEMNIFEVLMLGPEVREVFRRLGLKCVDRRELGTRTDYCTAAEKESLRDVALYHGQDVRALVNALNSLRVRGLSEEERDNGGR